jgi:hypothetical protein
VPQLSTSNLWEAPDDDFASLATVKTDKGWGSVMGVYELGFEAIAGNMESRSSEQAARCDAASDIFTPVGKDDRRRFMNVFLYAGEHAHPEAIPERGQPAAIEAPVRLKGYLDLAAGTREELQGGAVMYRDVEHVYVPIYVRCEKPMKIDYEVLQRSAEEIEASKIDPRLCRPAGGDAFNCLFERPKAIEGSCTFVATNAKYKEHNLSVGGRIEPGARGYTITVDRFAFH